MDLDPIALTSRLVARVRPSGKPLHPRGEVLRGVLTRAGGSRPSGVPWLDEAGTDAVLVRRSRGGGLPRLLPDVHGLAVRVPSEKTAIDLTFSSAGLGRWSRFVPRPHWDGRPLPLSTLMPYRGPDGPVLVAATATAPEAYRLLWATPTSDWVEFADLTLRDEETADRDVSFDSFVHPLPDTETYAWFRRLREPAYRAAREQSGRSLGDDPFHG